MENTNTRSANRFAFPSYGWVALLMLASALMGGAAGHAFDVAQPVVAAPATAPVIAQAEPVQSAATGDSSGVNELRQEMRALRLAQSLRSRGTESQPIPSAAAGDASSQGDLSWKMNALRQARKSVQSATAISVNAGQMTGTYLPGMQGLGQPGFAVSANAANLSDSAQIEIPAANPYLSNDARHPER